MLGAWGESFKGQAREGVGKGRKEVFSAFPDGYFFMVLPHKLREEGLLCTVPCRSSDLRQKLGWAIHGTYKKFRVQNTKTGLAGPFRKIRYNDKSWA
jgi:hypothetical protein